MNRIGDDPHLHYKELEDSCRKADVPLYAYIEVGPWTWRRKIEWELELCEQYPNDHFVFIDAFDYLFVGDVDELRSIAMWYLLLFPVDRNEGKGPWPYGELEENFDNRRKIESPWNYLNGSGPTGQGKHIRDAIKFGFKHFPWMEHATDQIFWTHVYLNGWGELDQQVVLTHPLWGAEEGELGHKNGRVINMVTMSRPQFLHASGRTWSFIPRELLLNDEAQKGGM